MIEKKQQAQTNGEIATDSKKPEHLSSHGVVGEKLKARGQSVSPLRVQRDHNSSSKSKIIHEYFGDREPITQSAPAILPGYIDKSGLGNKTIHPSLNQKAKSAPATLIKNSIAPRVPIQSIKASSPLGSGDHDDASALELGKFPLLIPFLLITMVALYLFPIAGILLLAGLVSVAGIANHYYANKAQWQEYQNKIQYDGGSPQPVAVSSTMAITHDTSPSNSRPEETHKFASQTVTLSRETIQVGDAEKTSRSSCTSSRTSSP